MAKDTTKKTAVTDPLEAAKIPTKPSAPRPPPPSPPIPLAGPTGEVEPAHAPVKKYRVAQDTSISLNGQIVKLNKDDVVSESSYGPAGMRRIIESNVALVEITE